MIAWSRTALVLASMLGHVVAGLVIAAAAFPLTSHATQQRVIRWWARRLLAILGVRLRVVEPGPGTRSPASAIRDPLRLGGPGAMLIMNHVSWLDIFIVHALRPAHFIAKAEISRWPLLGFLVHRSGTIFIERGKRHAVREINHRIATLLEAGHLVGMFPEGTTSDGDRLLPFHANLVQPAINVGAPIVVAGVRYRDVRGGRTDATLYVGDTTLFDSLIRLARNGPLVAELHLIDVLDPAGSTRHDIGREARAMIADRLRLGDERQEADEGLSIIVVPDFTPTPATRRREPGTPLDPRDELL